MSVCNKLKFNKQILKKERLKPTVNTNVKLSLMKRTQNKLISHILINLFRKGHICPVTMKANKQQ